MIWLLWTLIVVKHKFLSFKKNESENSKKKLYFCHLKTNQCLSLISESHKLNYPKILLDNKEELLCWGILLKLKISRKDKVNPFKYSAYEIMDTL